MSRFIVRLDTGQEVVHADRFDTSERWVTFYEDVPTNGVVDVILVTQRVTRRGRVIDSTRQWVSEPSPWWRDSTPVRVVSKIAATRIVSVKEDK